MNGERIGGEDVGTERREVVIVERGEGVQRGPRYPFGHAAWPLGAAALPLATAATFGPRNDRRRQQERIDRDRGGDFSFSRRELGERG